MDRGGKMVEPPKTLAEPESGREIRHVELDGLVVEDAAIDEMFRLRELQAELLAEE